VQLENHIVLAESKTVNVAGFVQAEFARRTGLSPPFSPLSSND